MSLVSHLFGSPALSGSVGKGGANKPTDLKFIAALLNVYKRANDQPVLPIESASGDALTPHIEHFQKQQLKVTTPDGRIDPGGKSMSGLIRFLRDQYTVRAVSAPNQGRLTWEVEGAEGGRYHSRRLHVPDANSGLTLGRGYDLRRRIGANVQTDLASAGVTGATAFKISTAAGKWGTAASRFVIDSDLLDYEISAQAQLKLFEKVYEFMLKEVKRISNKELTVSTYGKVDWNKLDQRILDVLVDLVYRGDYTNTSRTFLQKHVANNDFGKFKAEVAKKSGSTRIRVGHFPCSWLVTELRYSVFHRSGLLGERVWAAQ